MAKHIYEVVSKAVKVGGQVAPASRANGASANTIAANRVDFTEAIVVLNTGATTGSPTSVNVSVDLQHSDDGTTWSALASGVVSANGANQAKHAGVDLLGAKKFVRAVVSVSLSGGTNPEVQCAATLILAGSSKIPA
jgi:hypothetical protein